MGDTILRVDDIQKFYGNKGNLTKAMPMLRVRLILTMR